MNPSPVPFAILLVRLTDLDPQKRRESIMAILDRPQERAGLCLLLALLTDPEQSVRLTAIKALGELGDTRALPTLQALLSDRKQSARLRLAALRARVRLDHPHPFPHLLTAVQDPSVLVRKAAVSELMDRRDPSAVPQKWKRSMVCRPSSDERRACSTNRNENEVAHSDKQGQKQQDDGNAHGFCLVQAHMRENRSNHREHQANRCDRGEPGQVASGFGDNESERPQDLQAADQADDSRGDVLGPVPPCT
jgi:hypothetical protein